MATAISENLRTNGEAKRVAVIGHMTATANRMVLPKDVRRAAQLVRLNNFVRVATEDGQFLDHLAYLRDKREVPAKDPFSVWEMYLCSALLLSSHLHRHGFNTKVVNFIDSDTEEAQFRELAEFAPEIVVVSTTFVLSQKHLTDIGHKLRAALPNAFIVAGGHHVFTTLLYMSSKDRGDYLTSAKMDAFVYDTQGEAALLEICKSHPGSLSHIPSVVWQSPNGVIENTTVREENDINHTLIDFDQIPPNSVVHIRTARSCSFKCAFCSYPTIAGDLALMDVENVIGTLHRAKAAGVKAIFFVDDTFNVPRPRFESLIDRMIEEGINLPWYSFLRCQYVDEPLVQKMAQSGCRGVFLGVESGSNKMLKNMKKGAIVEFYRKGVRWLRDAGIVTVGSFIIGFPGETDETVAETQEFIENSGLDYYFIQPFYYLHHTPIHKRAKEWDLTGEGLFWSHKTMNWSKALEHVNRSFLEIKNATFINPDYTLWEIAYLATKGMTLPEIKAYRDEINALTRQQMERFGITSADVTSRDRSRVA